ncbi:MAG: DUF2336 domain-containing protein [Caulobacteraceae bacterium]
MVRSALTETDIHTLVRGVTPDERAIAAHKICRRIEEGVSDEERSAAEEVLRLMALDAAELVRRALAVTLKNSPLLPRDVAVKLAHDVESVAAPILSFSPVFTDEDLAEIVKISNELKRLAVARRSTLSETVTDALAVHAGEEALNTAFANDNAHFSEEALKRAFARFDRSETMAVALAYRKMLPPAISEKLVSLVSDQVRQRLVDRHTLSPETALSIAIGSRERATVDLVEQAGRISDFKAFVTHLNAQERLTPSLLLRALAQGNITFVEWALAELADVPHHRAWLMVHDGGPLGLQALYERAGLPSNLYLAFRAGVDTFQALQQEGGDLELPRFQQRMLERFLTRDAEMGASRDVDYLLERMDGLSRRAADAARRTAA